MVLLYLETQKSNYTIIALNPMKIPDWSQRILKN